MLEMKKVLEACCYKQPQNTKITIEIYFQNLLIRNKNIENTLSLCIMFLF